MSEIIYCYRCGGPACAVSVHACRMCIYFDPNVPRQCREDGAEDVQDKVKVNFCDWFKPSATAFDSTMSAADARAKNELSSLFSDEPSAKPDIDESTRSAEDLFK